MQIDDVLENEPGGAWWGTVVFFDNRYVSLAQEDAQRSTCSP